MGKQCLMYKNYFLFWLKFYGTTRGDSSLVVASYLLPRNDHTPQLPCERSVGSALLRVSSAAHHRERRGSKTYSLISHRRLLNVFSPGSSKISNSPLHLSWTHSTSRTISASVYPVHTIGSLVSRSFGRVDSHSAALPGCPSPGWNRTKQSKYGS